MITLKHIFFIILLFNCLHIIKAQKNNLLEYNECRIQHTQKGMKILGTWALGNVAYNGIALTQNRGESMYANQMNIMWNTVNLGLAIGGFMQSKKEDAGTFNLKTSLKAQQKLEKIYLVNTALDLSYITGGLLLRSMSYTNTNPAMMRGYGNSIIIQGSFLFVYDLFEYIIHKKNGKKLWIAYDEQLNKL